MLPQWLNLQDPFVKTVVYAAAGLIILIIVVRIVARRREAVADARRRAELRRSHEGLRLQQEEIKRLAEKIQATSSTSRIAGFMIARQVETIFSEPRPSSVAAVELTKALAAQKGANAIINLQTQQMPTGKWVASGDAVLVKLVGRRDTETP